MQGTEDVLAERRPPSQYSTLAPGKAAVAVVWLPTSVGIAVRKCDGLLDRYSCCLRCVRLPISVGIVPESDGLLYRDICCSCFSLLIFDASKLSVAEGVGRSTPPIGCVRARGAPPRARARALRVRVCPDD